MKISYSSRFAQLALVVSLAVVLLSAGGYALLDQNPAQLCTAWPLCLPTDVSGVSQLAHRVSVGVTTLLVAVLLLFAWRTQRDNRIILPLTSVFAALFMAEIMIGAVMVIQEIPVYLSVLHTVTAWLQWLVLIVLVAAAGLYSSDVVTFPPLDVRQRAKDFLALTKPIVVILLLVTTYAGMVVGGKALPPLALTGWVLLAGYMAAGGSSALNQYIDRDLDTQMQRTQKRPLAAGRMTPAEGLSFGLILSVLSFYIMAVFVNFLAAMLLLLGIFYYVILYSILLKKTTVQNIVIGGGAGAIPPLVGWVAVTGQLEISAFFLFAIIFMWTPPHFWALAIVRQKDYARAGVPMLPVVRGEKAARLQILIYTIELVILTLLMGIFNLAGSIYLVSAIVLGVWLLHTAWQVWRIQGNKIAWKMYRYSSMYLAFLFLALMLDAVILG